VSYDPWDAEREAALESLYEDFQRDPATKEIFYEQLYDEIVGDFTDSRMRSFYVNEPEVAVPALRALADARSLRSQHSTAAFLFAVVAAEVGLRSVLLKPIIYGLVHSATAAALITELAIAHKDEGFIKVLLDLLATHGGVDPRTYRRSGSSKSLWEELRTVGRKRNRVVHQAESASAEEAELAIDVAACILENLFPAVASKLGFHLHDSRLCEAIHNAGRI
jgi:hypothetical protein